MKSFIPSIVRVLPGLLVVSVVGPAAASAQTGDLQILKYTILTPPNTAATDSSVTFTLSVLNQSPEQAQNVVITDPLPPDVTFESVTSFPEDICEYDDPSRTVTCNAGTLEPGDGPFIDITVRTPAFATQVTNTASVESTTPDIDPSNNSSSATIDVVQFNKSDLSVEMTASASQVKVHEAVTFTTTVTNLGPHDAAGVSVELFTPANADIISLTPSQGTCSTTPIDTFECLLGPMAAGASATIDLVVKPQKDGLVLTFASASGYGDPLFFDPDFSNDFASIDLDAKYPGNADPSYTTRTTQVIPLDGILPNPCGGEPISLQGSLRLVFSSTFGKNRIRENSFTNYRNVRGIGLESGATYKLIGNSKTGSGRSFVFNPGFFPHEFTQVDNLQLIGGETHLLLHQNTHITVNANGTATAVADNPILECK